jgi:hypothetical protein
MKNRINEEFWFESDMPGPAGAPLWTAHESTGHAWRPNGTGYATTTLMSNPIR